MANETQSTELVKVDFNEYLATIEPTPDEVTESLCEKARAIVTWAKLAPNGIIIGETTYPTVYGVIEHVWEHYIRFIDGDDGRQQAEKVESLEGLADTEDFEERCDIRVASTAGIVVGFSLAKTSYNQLRVYAELLRTQSLRLSDVITEFYVTHHKMGRIAYNRLNFKPSKIVEQGKVSEDDLPF